MTNTQKKEYAKLLYLRENLTQKEIAIKVEVTEKTMGRWVATEKWDTLKASLTLTKEEMLKRLYEQINELTNAIAKKPEGERYANSKEADYICKISSSIRALEIDVSLADVTEVFKRFLNWLKETDLAKAQDFCQYHNMFLKSIIRKSIK